MSFLDQLKGKGILSEEQIPQIEALSTQKFGGSIDDALASIGIKEEDILKNKSEYYNLPTKSIDPKSISFDVLKYIPEDSATHYAFAPIGIKDHVLEVGVTQPENIEAMDALQFIAGSMGMPYKLFLISNSDLKVILGNYKGLSGEVDKALSDFDTTDISESEAREITDKAKNPQDKLKPGEEEKIVEDAPIIKIVAVIIRHAIEGMASDIHIENTGEKVKVRYRVDGILHTSLVLPMNVYSGIVARIKILAKMRLDEKRKPQDGGITTIIDGRKIDFRVSTLPTAYGEKVVMRILDSDRGVRALNELGMSEENLELVREGMNKPYGLILITGPTGSGKTTTLYSMLKEMDREKYNVVSLEDPVEYHIPDVAQSQVMPEIGYTFAAGLRSILRQDPDIILVGEIRDKETAQLAIQAALTGHLVLATLHTNNAIGAVPRLVDMGVDPYLIAPTLILAIAQRLVRTICPTGKKAVAIDVAAKKMIDKQFADLPAKFKKKLPIGKDMYEPVATSDCPSGLRGRMPVFEMFKIDKEIQSIILKNPVEGEIYKVAREHGMLTMAEDALVKNLQGLVPFQEVYNLGWEGGEDDTVPSDSDSMVQTKKVEDVEGSV